MTEEAKALDVLLRKAEGEIAEGMASGSGVEFWGAAASALDVLKIHREAVERWGVLQFKALVEGASRVPAREHQLIGMMTGAQLTADMRDGATSLTEDTAQREATKAEVIEVLKKLGTIGARLLVTLF